MRSANIPAHLVLRSTRLVGWFGQCVQWLKALSPYAAIELLLPGGSLIALLLWFARRHRTQTKLRLGRSWTATDRVLPRRGNGTLQPATARAVP